MKKLSESEIIDSLNEIVFGCRGVKQQDGANEEAKTLATLVIRDLNRIIRNLKLEGPSGDNNS